MRRTVGFFLAPAVFIALLALPLAGLSPAAHRLAAVMAAVVVLWVTEALPLPVTALLGAAASVVLEVAPAEGGVRAVRGPADVPLHRRIHPGARHLPHQLDRRLAYAVLSLPWIGARPARILVAFGAVTAFISAWICNTATTAMMFAHRASRSSPPSRARTGGTRWTRATRAR